ncbi:MAG TPA: MBL fold metallo-hydrolase [Myxococcaceae bacterium]|nr:MBL fold metallo-hydrolase [Myxococcaceae bacterium]
MNELLCLAAGALAACGSTSVDPALRKPDSSVGLSYSTFISEGIVRASGARLPEGDPIVSSPITSTLIVGATDAVLVDPPLTIEQTRLVGDWVERSGNRLKYIYVTHAHGDHWFGSAQLVRRFPGVVVYATPGTIALMPRQATEGRQRVYDRDFPGLIGETPVLAKPVPSGGFEIEGHRLVAVEVGHSDTDGSSVLHVPDLGLVVAGDVVYNGVHQFLLEAGNDGIEQWLRALDKVEALHPRIVIAGHKNKALPDDPQCIEQTRRYLIDARRLLAQKPTPRAYYEAMLALYPDRLNRGPLWYSGVGLLTSRDARETSG